MATGYEAAKYRPESASPALQAHLCHSHSA